VAKPSEPENLEPAILETPIRESSIPPPRHPPKSSSLRSAETRGCGEANTDFCAADPSGDTVVNCEQP